MPTRARRKRWWIHGTHWPASLDYLARSRPVREHLQGKMTSEVALWFPRVHVLPAPYTQREMEKPKGKAKLRHMIKWVKFLSPTCFLSPNVGSFCGICLNQQVYLPSGYECQLCSKREFMVFLFHSHLSPLYVSTY